MIDKSGKWWVGRAPEDTKEYLIAFSSDVYVADDFRLAKCDFGSWEFQLWPAEITRFNDQRSITFSFGHKRYYLGGIQYWLKMRPTYDENDVVIAYSRPEGPVHS